MTYAKMIKFGTRINSFFAICVLSCLVAQVTKIPIFYETLHEHGQYGDIHANIFSNIFFIFQNLFLGEWEHTHLTS
jgi:hypothetical protein